MAEVEGALIDHLQEHVLTDGALEKVLAAIRTEVAAQLPKQEADTAALEAELGTAKGEQKRTALIHNLEARIVAAKRTPEDQADLVTKVETGARAKVQVSARR